MVGLRHLSRQEGASTILIQLGHQLTSLCPWYIIRILGNCIRFLLYKSEAVLLDKHHKCLVSLLSLFRNVCLPPHSSVSKLDYSTGLSHCMCNEASRCNDFVSCNVVYWQGLAQFRDVANFLPILQKKTKCNKQTKSLLGGWWQQHCKQIALHWCFVMLLIL